MRTLLLITIGTLISRPATADTPSPKVPDAAAGRRLFADGQAEYRKADYVSAAAKFQAAFDSDPDPAYLFNLAQADRLANECAAAVAAYRKFLALVPDAPNAPDVQSHLHEMEACASKLTATTVRVAAPPPSSTVAPDPHGYRKPLGIGLGVGGVVLVGAGVWFVHKITTAEGERRQCVDNPDCDWAGIDERGRRSSALAIGSFVAAGVALVAGGTFVWLDHRQDHRETIAITPTAGGGMIVGTAKF